MKQTTQIFHTKTNKETCISCTYCALTYVGKGKARTFFCDKVEKKIGGRAIQVKCNLYVETTKTDYTKIKTTRKPLEQTKLF